MASHKFQVKVLTVRHNSEQAETSILTSSPNENFCISDNICLKCNLPLKSNKVVQSGCFPEKGNATSQHTLRS